MGSIIFFRKCIGLGLFGFVVCAGLQGAWGQEWAHYGADAGGSRYSLRSQITPENVDQLVPAWVYRTGHADDVSPDSLAHSKFEATPILAEGKLAFCTPFNVIVALDPKTGREIWRHDPKLDLTIKPAVHFNCRGISTWRDPQAAAGSQCAARLFMGTNDHRVIAVDLADGKPCKSFGENGSVIVEPNKVLDWPGEYQITSPPAIVGDVVVVGSAIADNARAEEPSGAVHAFDARDGSLRWVWDPIPHDKAQARAQGWEGDVLPTAGSANVWSIMSGDEKRGLVFLPTSSPSPDVYGGDRPGDNRHANSIVALEAATGKLRWAFQTVHHDIWDYDLASQPMLVTITKDGKPRDVVIQLTKTGLVFTLDRDTGEPVFPVQERPVPQDAVKGEWLSPTQPFPVAPLPLVPSAITPDEAFGLTPFDRKACAERIANTRHKGLFTPPSTQETILFPFTGGGSNWGSGAYDPVHNRLYANTSSAINMITLVKRADVPNDKGAREEKPFGKARLFPMTGAPFAMTSEMLVGPLGLPCNPPPWGVLHAIDMNDGSVVWETPLGTTESLAPLGIAFKWGTPNSGGPLATAGGLIFIGATMDNYLRAFDAKSGKEIWAAQLPAGGQATPMSYEWEGRQYIVIAVGGHSEMKTKAGDYVMAFALPNKGEAGPTLLSRTLYRPGGRFTATVIGALFVLASIIAGLLLLRVRRKKAKQLRK